MGLFLGISGVSRATPAEVEAALAEFAANHGGSLVPAASGAVIAADRRLVLAKSEQGNITVVYPEGFVGWDEAAEFLSAKLSNPVLSLHIHDSDLWMYLLLDCGKLVDKFNPIPDYWDTISDEEIAAWAGDAEALVRHWPGVERSQVERYLVNWEEEDYAELDGKAYVDDEFQVGEDWQITDFMTKVNLVYPEGDGEPSDARTYSFVTDNKFQGLLED